MSFSPKKDSGDVIQGEHQPPGCLCGCLCYSDVLRKCRARGPMPVTEASPPCAVPPASPSIMQISPGVLAALALLLVGLGL